MAAQSKRVVRLDLWVDPVFDQILNNAAGLALDVVPATGADDTVSQTLSRAHVYHVSAAKDELPKQWFVSPALIATCPDLLCVSSSGAGYDTVDVEACTRAGIAVVNQSGGNAASVAEHTMALLLGVSRRMSECDRRMRTETGFSREEVMGHEIRGKTIGLVGIGHIGSRVAALAAAFGMKVLACDPLLSTEEIAKRGAQAVSIDELLAMSDVVSLHCPRDASTLRLMDAGAFSRMKPGALFVTTARGGIHVEAALIDALQSGHLGGAGVDVWDQEPPPLDHPMLRMPNVFATFHTAGVTHEARRNMAAIAAEQIRALLSSTAQPERPARLVNPAVWPLFSQRFQKILG